MKKLLRWCVLGALTGVGASSAVAATYWLDDGTGESNVGLRAGGSFMWLNHYTVRAGANKIVAIRGAFGPVPNGAAVTAHLWSDPNGDGNPLDAVSLASSSSGVAHAGTDVYNSFAIPSITMATGTSFFVGFRMSHAPSMWPARLDTTTAQGQSWIAIGNNQNNLSGALNLLTDSAAIDSNPLLHGTNGKGGNWMVQATAVPEPATMVALTLGAAGLLRRRRR